MKDALASDFAVVLHRINGRHDYPTDGRERNLLTAPFRGPKTGNEPRKEWVGFSSVIAILMAVKARTITPAHKIDSLIVKTPGFLGGRPRVRSHRVAVHRIAGWWQLGLSIEEIAEKNPSLGPAEIHAALAYYHLHRAEIDGYLAEERATADTKAAGLTAK